MSKESTDHFRMKDGVTGGTENSQDQKYHKGKPDFEEQRHLKLITHHSLLEKLCADTLAPAQSLSTEYLRFALGLYK